MWDLFVSWFGMSVYWGAQFANDYDKKFWSKSKTSESGRLVKVMRTSKPDAGVKAIQQTSESDRLAEVMQ